MKMRELAQRTGFHRETIRVYLCEGLIPEPARQDNSVADYGEERLQAILAVRRLQRENRLTLAQIGAIIGGQGMEGRIAIGVSSVSGHWLRLFRSLVKCLAINRPIAQPKR